MSFGASAAGGVGATGSAAGVGDGTLDWAGSDCGFD